MKRLLKWLGFILGGVIVLALLSAAAVTVVGSSKFSRTYNITPAALTVSPTADDMARFQQLEKGLGCTFCHGPDLGGRLVDADLGLYAPNLTTGNGGVGATAYSDDDLLRAIRHGVGSDGRALLLMPADQFNNLSERDMAAALAFVRGFPPVDNEVPPAEPNLFLRFFTGLGLIPSGMLVPASGIDHAAPFTPHVEPAETAEYGRYLTSLYYCTHCHRADFRGGTFPFPDPEAPRVPNITSEGMPGTWTVDEFRTTLRSGVTPAGRPLNQNYMSAEEFQMYSDEQLGAIYLFLQSLPPAEEGGS